ncbi:MAG: RNA 2',3'-cyclic phosphodiesterase [Betaproteobacteria bacterium HGW-Betaproteobacteria-14]|nr:MAG: RNA 2',3'-cyclic phosphodiesterase [Betaproteobacteria bacterium HGW-Betaproteobacteria-14]
MAAERRVFFALWPEEEIARQFDAVGRQARKTFGGRRMRRETLHLTLAFMGGIAPDRLAALCAIASTVKLPIFDMAFDRLQCQRRKRIVWAFASMVPSGLLELADSLHTQLKSGGFRTEERPFAAHVTLLRNSRCATDAPDASLNIEWPVRDFVLAESGLAPEGAHYHILERWPLGQT